MKTRSKLSHCNVWLTDTLIGNVRFRAAGAANRFNFLGNKRPALWNCRMAHDFPARRQILITTHQHSTHVFEFTPRLIDDG